MVYFVKKCLILGISLVIIIMIFTIQELGDINWVSLNPDIKEYNDKIHNKGNAEERTIKDFLTADTDKSMTFLTRKRNSKMSADERKDVNLLTKSLSMTASGNQTVEKEKRFWRFYESLRLKTANSPITFVLLITYGRSGSSWLGDMISQADSTFYVFEPLQRILSQGYFKESFVCFSNNTCRIPRKLIERHTTVFTALYKLFTCQMSRLSPIFKSSFTHSLRSKSHKIALNQCRSKMSSALNSCLKKMESICASTSHRVLKTIRISMELVDILMNLWPKLKIVHLIRDPRAITHSRLHSSEFSMAQNVLTHAQDLCARMYEDVIRNLKLEKLYHNRIKLVLFEALTARPLDGVRYIYKFLNMNVTEQVVQWIYHTTHANKMANSKYYGIVRSNATEVATSWRVKMDLLKVQVIDYFCKDLYSLVGFVPMNSTKQLRSLMVPSRQGSNIDGFV